MNVILFITNINLTAMPCGVGEFVIWRSLWASPMVIQIKSLRGMKFNS